MLEYFKQRFKVPEYYVEVKDAVTRAKLIKFLKYCPGEFLDVALVLEDNQVKYPDTPKGPNWLQPNGTTMDHVSNHNSMSHHFSESYCKVTLAYKSKRSPKLHLAVRALMGYCREFRGIVHENDRSI